MERPDVLTVYGAAERAQMSPDAIWKAIRAHELATVDLGFHHQAVIRPADLDAWLKQRQINGLTVEDVMAMCGMSKSGVIGWVRRGQVRARKILGRWVFDPADVEAFAKSRGIDVDLKGRAA